MRYGKRVLEIGCGWYSTPLLRAMSSQVTTIETDGEWASKFQKLTQGSMHVVPDIRAGAEVFSSFQWDVVFVDCDPVDQRVSCVELFLNRRCCVVAHDTEATNYSALIPKIKYVRHYDFIMPRTSHLSNILDVTL